MYHISDYDMMFSDRLRRDAMLTSIRAIVRPGDVVVELGTGVGYFAVAAARCGAGHVYAIETNDAISLGPELAAANGCADRITFVHGHSRHQTLPELGDALIWDLRGSLPLVNDQIASVADARTRLLRPGARLQNMRDILFAAPTEGPRRFRTELHDAADDSHGIDRSPVFARSRTIAGSGDLANELLLAAGAEWFRIEWATVVDADASGELVWEAARDGAMDGLCVWFDAEMAGGARILNAPDQPGTAYGRTFLPFYEPLAVLKGDRIEGKIRFKSMHGEYVTMWEARVVPPAGSGRAPVRAQRSSLDALAISPARLAELSLDHRPAESSTLRLLGTICELTDGERSVQEIAQILMTRHPGLFADLQEASRVVARALSELSSLRDVLPQ